MITRAKEASDMENTGFISEAEWYRKLNASVCALWDLLVKADPERYVREQTFTGDGSTVDFSVAADYYGTVDIYYISDATQGIYEPLPRLAGREQAMMPKTPASIPRGWTYRYNVSAPETPLIRLLPTPDSTSDCLHLYVVAPPSYATDGSDSAVTLDGIAGWEEFVVLDMAISAGSKEQASTQALERKQMEIKTRIEEMAENRTIGDAGHVIDVTQTGYIDPAGIRYFSKPAY